MVAKDRFDPQRVKTQKATILDTLWFFCCQNYPLSVRGCGAPKAKRTRAHTSK